MLHRAAFRARCLAHVHGPFPSRLVSGASNGHAAQAHQLKPALFKRPHLIRLFKPFQDHLQHWATPSPSANGKLRRKCLLEKTPALKGTSKLECAPLAVPQADRGVVPATKGSMPAKKVRPPT